MNDEDVKEKEELLAEYKEVTKHLNQAQKEWEMAEKTNSIGKRAKTAEKILMIERHLESIRKNLRRFGVTF